MEALSGGAGRLLSGRAAGRARTPAAEPGGIQSAGPWRQPAQRSRPRLATAGSLLAQTQEMPGSEPSIEPRHCVPNPLTTAERSRRLARSERGLGVGPRPRPAPAGAVRERCGAGGAETV